MGIFGAIRPKAMDSKQLSEMLYTYIGKETSSGQSINSETAMRAMAVHSCVRIKANSLLQLPCHLFKASENSKDKAKDHRLYKLLHDQPNEWMSAPEFWAMCSAHLDLRGNFICLKAGQYDVYELIPIPFTRVIDVIQSPDYGLFYRIQRPGTNGTIDTIPGNRIMHIRGLTLNGFMGLNPVEYARESIGLALATEKHGAKLFSNGAMLGGILKHPGSFKDPGTARAVLDAFNSMYSSVESAHKTALLEDGMSWEKVGLTNEDSQYMEARNFQKKEIVDLFFGLPLSMLQSGDKVATYASAEQFALSYVTYSIVPYAVQIEAAIKRDLLTDEEKKTHYAKFELRGLLRGTFTEQMAGFATGIDKEIFSPNECRDWLDLNPYEGGDEYRTRTSTVKEQTGSEGGNDEPEI